ncbi:hypothetical protein SAMN04488063_2680 [Halopelagius inordinatus]|uniref:Uncharacterized protein n=1 Tax=Halopelagius inordinatus TaxID=553467 RepID=A0A1I2TNG1_9EURY|nr:DUF6498-containing protein [Halopelagius inordinatus]SFG63861.1 hypothetical protein SAMN04488063_2680 [Halopelagius inordinatus]
MSRGIRAATARIRAGSYLGPVAVVASNAVAPVGVVAFGWSATALLGVFVLELAAVLFWSAVKVPFAAKRPNNAIDEHQLLGPLQAKRGGVELPGPLPPVYLRNVPTLVVLVVLLAPMELGAAVLVFSLPEPTLTAEITEQILLGGVGVFLGRGVETAADYFRDGGYRDHSARSVVLAPFKYVFGVGTLLVVVGSSGVESEAILALMVAGKLAYDLRTIQVERDEEKRGVFYRLYGSGETEIPATPVAEPDGEPTVRARPSRTVAVADALYRGAAYTLTSTALLFYALGAFLLVFAPSLAVFPLAVILAFGSLHATTRYLRYGTVEYRCYDGVLVTYDTLLDEPQERIERTEVADVSVETDFADRTFDTATVEFDRRGDDGSTVQFTVPDPEEVRRRDAGKPLSVVHVEEPEAIADALGVAWQFERSTGRASAD